jgi:hypothetical protein
MAQLHPTLGTFTDRIPLLFVDVHREGTDEVFVRRVVLVCRPAAGELIEKELKPFVGWSDTGRVRYRAVTEKAVEIPPAPGVRYTLAGPGVTADADQAKSRSRYGSSGRNR